MYPLHDDPPLYWAQCEPVEWPEPVQCKNITHEGFYMDREQNIYDLSTKEGKQAYKTFVYRPFIEWIRLYEPYNKWYLSTLKKYCP